MNQIENCWTPRLAFFASTGRTATLFLATCLNRLAQVVGLHEGHLPGDPPQPRVPLINIQHRQAWRDPAYAARLVAEKRAAAILGEASGGAELLLDAAFYNAPLLSAIRKQHPDAMLFAIFRRCEGFVRSATILRGEDRQPVGWPGLSKPLTDRERFISLGRPRPAPGHRDRALWPGWTAVQRNIWLWTTVNGHLHRFAGTDPNCHRLFLEDLVEKPRAFWTSCLRRLDILSCAALAECIDFSAAKINGRTAYQIGRIADWNAEEQALYAERARPLENEIYG